MRPCTNHSLSIGTCLALVLTSSPSPLRSTFTVPPSFKSPNQMASASGFFSWVTTSRATGRAPKAGS